MIEKIDKYNVKYREFLLFIEWKDEWEKKRVKDDKNEIWLFKDVG